MKKGYKAIAVTLSMVLALTGVVGGTPVKGEAKAKIKLNKKKVTLTVGKSVKLKLKGTGKKAKWSSSNESVAMVSSTGKVMAVSVGKAKITAKIKKKKYSCSVTVKGKTTEPEEFWPVTQTKTPTATKAPAATVPVRKTNAPSNTKNPAGTGRPYGTNVPGKTDAPEVTKTPVKTEEPEETKAPVKTEAPEETKAPAKTEAPEETKAPVKTEKPEETKAPAKTEKPEVTKAPVKTEKPNDTASPVKPRVVYQFVGSITGWGGPDTYPSSKDHEQGDGGSNSVNESLTNIKVGIGSYKCGLELMNKYSDNFIGASNELSQIIKGMTDPVIRVTLKNGGAASAYNWYDEMKCPSGEEVALTKEFLRNEYVGLFGNDDTITKVEIYDRAAAVVEPEDTKKPEQTAAPEDTKKPEQTAEPEDTKKPEQTKKPEDTKEPEQTAAPENPSRPEESYTPNIPVVTPGSADADNEALASNMKASLQKLSNGKILVKVVNNNNVTVNFFRVKITWKDAQGNNVVDSTGSDWDAVYGYFLAENGLLYDWVAPVGKVIDKIDLSKSEITFEVEQTTYTDSPLTSKITVSSQKCVDEDGEITIDYTVKNNDSKEAHVNMTIFYMDKNGNIIDTGYDSIEIDAGKEVSHFSTGPSNDETGEFIDFASYEIYINGYMYSPEE